MVYSAGGLNKQNYFRWRFQSDDARRGSSFDSGNRARTNARKQMGLRIRAGDDTYNMELEAMHAVYL